MKKLARLTALLLTGALLLVLTACGAAPLTPEQQAKKQILTAINQYRSSRQSSGCWRRSTATAQALTLALTRWWK